MTGEREQLAVLRERIIYTPCDHELRAIHMEGGGYVFITKPPVADDTGNTTYPFVAYVTFMMGGNSFSCPDCGTSCHLTYPHASSVYNPDTMRSFYNAFAVVFSRLEIVSELE